MKAETKMIPRCCVCKIIQVNGNWDKTKKFVKKEGEFPSDGFCPEHEVEAKKEFEIYKLTVNMHAIQDQYRKMPNGPARIKLWEKDKNLMLKIRALENSLNKTSLRESRGGVVALRCGIKNR